jgi:DNA-binding transcriptional ArsR family regulator
MPDRVRPDLPTEVEDAIECFGHPVRVAIMRYLHDAGAATRGEIATGLDLVPKTVQYHVTALDTLGAVEATPGRHEDRQGTRPRYSLDQNRVTKLHDALGDNITHKD